MYFQLIAITLSLLSFIATAEPHRSKKDALRVIAGATAIPCPGALIEGIKAFFPLQKSGVTPGYQKSLSQFAKALAKPPTGMMWVPTPLIHGVLREWVRFDRTDMGAPNMLDLELWNGRGVMTGFDSPDIFPRFFLGQLGDYYYDEDPERKWAISRLSVNRGWEQNAYIDPNPVISELGLPRQLSYILAQEQEIAPILAHYLHERLIPKLVEYLPGGARSNLGSDQPVLTSADLDLLTACLYLFYRLPPEFNSTAINEVLRGQTEAFHFVRGADLLKRADLAQRYLRVDLRPIIKLILSVVTELGPFPRMLDTLMEREPALTYVGRPIPCYRYADWEEAINLLASKLGIP